LKGIKYDTFGFTISSFYDRVASGHFWKTNPDICVTEIAIIWRYLNGRTTKKIFCKQYLASYKKPKSIEFIKEIPKNPYGKVLKRELREKYWVGEVRRVR